MDISVYISELLYEHDCIIIPGFGGFVCNYKSAEIHPILHTVQAPSKAITFNRNLQNNDGLLANYIATRDKLTLDAANNLINGWVASAKSLLRGAEEINLGKVGKLHSDIEHNLQFVQNEKVNYLKAAYGLRTITVEPILRGKQIDFTEKFTDETRKPAAGRKQWRVAAIVLVLVCMIGVAQLMWMGVEVKGWRLDEAGIYKSITGIFKTPEPEFHPIPVEQVTPPVTDSFEEGQTESVDTLPLTPDPTLTAENNTAENIETRPEPIKESAPEVKAETFAPTTSTGQHTYYVIIGAFREDENVDAAIARLQQRFPDSVIIREKGIHLTKIGYSVGHHFYEAKSRLEDAQQEDPTYWLLKK